MQNIHIYTKIENENKHIHNCKDTWISNKQKKGVAGAQPVALYLKVIANSKSL